MSNECYVTLLSNNSTEFYNNTLSAFTNNIVPPLELDGDWKVGITDIRHNYLLDHVFSNKDDEIIFPLRMGAPWKSMPINRLPFYVARYSTHPAIYNTAYFHDFLKHSKLENFDTDLTLKEYDVEPTTKEENKLKVVVTFDEEELAKEVGEEIIEFSVLTTYTGKQILYKYLYACKKLLEKGGERFNTAEILGVALKILAEMFIEQIKRSAKTLSTYHYMKAIGSFMYVYTDIIRPRHVGNQYHKILSILPIEEIKNEYTAIKNVQYYPVDRKRIDDISIKLTDENSQQIPLEGGYNPTCLTLHFKKD